MDCVTLADFPHLMLHHGFKDEVDVLFIRPQKI